MNAKIEEARAKAAAALEAEIARITRDEELRALAPDGIEIKRTTGAGWDGVSTITYEVQTGAQVAVIVEAWRGKHGAFLPIGKYTDGTCVVTAYPTKDYLKPEALKAIEDDAIEARNSLGRGFSSVEFSFYPAVAGEKIEVHIDLAFRCSVAGFAGRIDAHYNRNGFPTKVEKTKPEAYRAAAYTVTFGGGSEDAADWRGVFNVDAFLGEVTK